MNNNIGSTFIFTL